LRLPLLSRKQKIGHFNDTMVIVKSWVEISGQRLIANYNLLAHAAGSDTAVLAVIKANAYGHGSTLCAPVLARAGAQWLGVTDAAEGAAVRQALTAAGLALHQQPQILVMCGILEDDAHDIVQHSLTPVVWEQQQIEWLAAAVHQHAGSDAPFPIHLEIDTGMARQGISPGEQLHTLLHWLKRQPRITLHGVLTHFAASEVVGSALTVTQRNRFEEAIAAVQQAGFQPAWVHAGNSSTIDNHGAEENLLWLRNLAAATSASPMVRSGIALYGYCLPLQQAPSSPSASAKIQPALQPLMTWKARIIGIRNLTPGDTVGYNAIFTAAQPMRVALLPIGYADGLRRELSSSNTHSGGWTIIHGQRAPILGRISMNLTVVDVTKIPGITIGDEAIILGDGITADDHAHLAHTISYEIVCGIRATPRLVP
jgi:alanine racemase